MNAIECTRKYTLEGVKKSLENVSFEHPLRYFDFKSNSQVDQLPNHEEYCLISHLGWIVEAHTIVFDYYGGLNEAQEVYESFLKNGTDFERLQQAMVDVKACQMV